MKLPLHLGRACALAALLLLARTGAADAQLARELGLVPDTDAPAAAPAVLPTESAFALAQLRHDRVRNARVETRFQIKRLFHEQGIRYPAAEVFLRIFKRERSLELWVRPEGDEQFSLLKTYTICALAGELGPKRRQGDAQVPEGFYTIDSFNPYSEYHLSLHVDYPNRRDRLNGPVDADLGGEIFIHGGCNSEGCLALTDAAIKELYWVAVEARAVGQKQIPVHIFPARLEDRDLQILTDAFATSPDLGAFWASLKPGYDFFEQHRRLPGIGVDSRGAYLINGVAAPLGDVAADPADGTRLLGAPVVPPAADTAGKPLLGRPIGGG